MCEKCLIDIFPFNQFESDAELIQELSQNLTTVNPALVNLDNYIFNPFEANESDDRVLEITEADPDLHFFNDFVCLQNVLNCTYFSMASFIDKMLTSDNDNLSLIHFNIRSLQKNCEKVDNFLSCIGFKFSVIALTETWLTASNYQCYSIDGYNCEHQLRSMRSDFLDYNVRYDLSNVNNFVSLCLLKYQNLP
jgi:hypothetical protein